MNVLLIYPEFPDTFWSFKHALRFIGKKSSSPPLGLMTVAAMLPTDWDKRLVDLNVSRLHYEDLQWANLVFISAMTVQRKSVYQIIDQCHEVGVKVVAGGPLFTIEYNQFPGVDHFVLNEAELTLPPFILDFESGKAAPIYASNEFADLNQTPIPQWNLVQMKYYATMNIQYSRGCPYNCEFCNVTALLGHKPRVKRADQIIYELDSLYQCGWRQNVFFVDDNLIGNKRRLKEELLPALIDWRRDKAGFQFTTEASINLADDDDLMEMMAAAGFSSVFIGIETPEECSLAEVGKKQNLKRDLIADIKKIQRAGIQVQGGFIVGFDHDTPSTFWRVSDFIQKSGIVTAMVGLLQAPPGTQLYQRLHKAGRLLERMSGDNVDGTTNIIPVMNLDVLKEGYRSILQYLYSPEVYYQRIRTFLKEYKPPKIKIRLEFKELMEYALAFQRSVIRLGILGKERKQYWKLFFWTLFCRPKVLPLAITLMVYGYHFRRIIERVA